ncbi:MAG: hypothetical protein ACI8RZ_002789, partial [Myxococcota bacterium]
MAAVVGAVAINPAQHQPPQGPLSGSV